MFSEVWASRGRKPVGVQKNAPFSTEKNEPLTKVLSLKTKKFSSNYVFGLWAILGNFGETKNEFSNMSVNIN